MMDDYTRAAMAYLDEAQPRDGGWSYADARAWIDAGFEPAAKGLCAALRAIGVTG